MLCTCVPSYILLLICQWKQFVLGETTFVVAALVLCTYRGKFAIVKRCTEKTTGKHYAAKILKKRRRGKSVREDILMEIDIMRQGMDHNRIIKLYEVYESKNEIYIIIEL